MRTNGINLKLSIVLEVMCMSLVAASVVLHDPFLGIHPQDENYYKPSSGVISCKDGSNKFTEKRVNDNFCDCIDGTDEPGTAACPNGRFYCKNAGHAPLILFSSRVNDGICDCCDGSDEYERKIKCPNTCWEAGKVARVKLKKQIAMFKEGASLRRQEIEQGKLAMAKDEAELSRLRNEENVLRDIVQRLQERKELIEKAEEKERLKKENEEREREAKEKIEREKNDSRDGMKEENAPIQEFVESSPDDEIGTLHESTSDEDVLEEHVNPTTLEAQARGASSVEESLPTGVMQGSGGSETEEGMSKEEMGHLVASRWTRNSNNKHANGADGTEEEDMDHNMHEEMPEARPNEESDAYSSENEADMDDDAEDGHEGDAPVDSTTQKDEYESDDDELDLPDTSSMSSYSSWLGKIKQSMRNIIRVFNVLQAPVNITDADFIRKEFGESSTKLSKMQSTISRLNKKLKQDFGPERQFYLFYDQCFERKQNKYTYNVCPFKRASQVEGYTTTRLGRWDRLEDTYQTMIFSNGDKCWNGPNRSLKVKLECGLKNEITSVEEPSRCEYMALFYTPLVCIEEKLKILEDKLNLMNIERHGQKDEL